MVHTAPCAHCGQDVPAGRFCAWCGAARSAGDAEDRFRRSAYVVAPRERVIRPWLTSALFPQLPRRSRAAFRVALIAMGLVAVGSAILRWQVPIVALSVSALPVAFAVYLREARPRKRIPLWLIVVATFLALGLGVAWALIAGPIVAAAYTATLGGRMDLSQLLLCGIAIPGTYGLALTIPAAAVRLMDRTRRQSLDGFTIGAWGAMVANAAATATLLIPQLAMGVTADNQSVSGLLGEAAIEGVAWPLGSTATGGMFGIALWMNPAGKHSRRYRKSLVVPAALLGALGFSIAMGVVDVLPLPLWPYIALELLIAMVTVVALRMVIADSVLHEAAQDPEPAADSDADAITVPEETLLCDECDHTVARMPFCSVCGLAISAKSTAPPSRNAHLRVMAPLAGGVGLALSAAVATAELIHPAPTSYVCPPDCGRPPIGDPVQSSPRFIGDHGAFSVAYPGDGANYDVVLNPPGMNGVQLRYTAGDTGMIALFGEPARDRTPMQIARSVLADKYPGAVVAYEIPNASLGYESGYGVVADVFPRDSSIMYTRLRVIVLAAIKHDYALIATAVGPYHEFSPDYGNGHPSGANVEVAMDMGKYVNSFRWPGDPDGPS